MKKYINIQSDVSNEEGVSPVIGVILMVAITVILAAVIGTFALGFADNVDETAQAGVEISEESDGTTVRWISSGNADTVVVLIDGTQVNTMNSVGTTVTVAVQEGESVSALAKTEEQVETGGEGNVVKTETAEMTSSTYESTMNDSGDRVVADSEVTTVSLINYDGDYAWTSGDYDPTGLTEVVTVDGEERLHVEGGSDGFGNWTGTQAIDVSSYDEIQVTANVTSYTTKAGFGVSSPEGPITDPNNSFLDSEGETTATIDVSTVDTVDVLFIGKYVDGSGSQVTSDVTISEVEVTAEE